MHIIHPLSKKAKLVLNILAKMIKSARLSSNMSQEDLARRLNVNRLTVSAIEKGSPTVGIGIVIEAAAIVGVPLLATDIEQLNAQAKAINNIFTLLPERAGRKPKEIDDDF